jgi:hypothetical protein
MSLFAEELIVDNSYFDVTILNMYLYMYCMMQHNFVAHCAVEAACRKPLLTFSCTVFNFVTHVFPQAVPREACRWQPLLFI